MFQLRTIQMPDAGGPVIPDRLTIAELLNIVYPASAAALGTVGAVTAGSAYTYTPTIAPTGAVVTAQVSSGGIVTTPLGYLPVLRATMKVVGTPTVGAGGGGTGFVTNDTVNFGNGVILTAATVVSGAVTVWSVAAAGIIANPGGLPNTNVPMVSTSGVGVGATANLSWGINTVVIDDSGNCSTIATGFTVTSVDGNGTGGALAAGAVAGAGAPIFRMVGPFVNDGIPAVAGANGGLPVPSFGVLAGVPSTDVVVELNAKVLGYASVKLQPRLAANSVVAGTFDAFIIA